jgi:hypothetical protein
MAIMRSQCSQSEKHFDRVSEENHFSQRCFLPMNSHHDYNRSVWIQMA